MSTVRTTRGPFAPQRIQLALTTLVVSLALTMGMPPTARSTIASVLAGLLSGPTEGWYDTGIVIQALPVIAHTASNTLSR